MATQPGIADRLVGRHAELEIIQAQIALALSGEGSILLLGGEAGVGKSRLIAEVADRFVAATPQSQVLIGHCFEGSRILAYAPLLDLLRAYLGTKPVSILENLFAPDPAAFVTLLPETQARFPAIQPLAGTAPQQEKQRVFRALLGFIGQLAGEQPLLIVFEDLHWSDDTSLEFLVQLARSIQRQPVLVAATFRTDEEHPGLRKALIEIGRARLGIEQEIKPLAIEEVDLLLREVFNQPYSIRPDFLRAIFALTEGNPFFVEETVRSLIDAGDIFQEDGRWSRKELTQLRIPRSVEDALARRTDGLDDFALSVLESAAVIGQRFDFVLLQRLTGNSEPDLIDALRSLIDTRLIDELSAERYRFHHALIRESVYDRLLARERRARHASVAEEFEELHAGMPEPWLADLAYHFYAAERWEKALDYACAAGERALALFAPHAAVEQFSRVLDCLERLGKPPTVRVLRQRGRAYETLGAFDQARRDYDAALAMARTREDRYGEWEALVDLGRSWEGLDYDRAGDWFGRAIDLARKLDDPVALAHSLNRIGNWYVNREYVDEGREAHLEALAIFERLEDEAGIAATNDYLGTVADIAGDLPEMRARYERAIATFEQEGDRERLASTLTTMAALSSAFVFDTVSAVATATNEEAEAWVSRGLRLAREIGWRAGEAFGQMSLGGLYVSIARYGEAYDLLTSAIEIAREIDHLEWLTCGTSMLGHFFQEVLEPDLAVRWLEESTELAHRSGSRHFIHLNTGFFVDSLIAKGMLDRAGKVLEAFSLETPMQTIGQRRLWSSRVNWLLATGDADGSLQVIDRLFQTGLNVSSSQSIPLLAWQRGRALAQLGRAEDAEGEFRAALAGFEMLDHPGRCWKLNLELARVYHSTGRVDDARSMLVTAIGTIDRLASTIHDDQLRRQFHQRATDLLGEAGGAPRKSAIALDRLTARERDVGLLVARGLSNRQIADELFIGERTVETHVGNILGKLGFNSRTQIATWIVDATSTSSGSSELP